MNSIEALLVGAIIGYVIYPVAEVLYAIVKNAWIEYKKGKDNLTD